jgi:hypothetical protein
VCKKKAVYFNMWKNILILVLLTSCGPAWHLKQARKHELKAIAKGAEVKTDTIYITKEVIVPEIKFDTVLRQVNFNDTIVVEKEKVITRVKVNTVTKEIYVETKCPADTVKIEVPVTIKKEIKVKGGIKWWWLIIAAAAGLIVGWLKK